MLKQRNMRMLLFFFKWRRTKSPMKEKTVSFFPNNYDLQPEMSAPEVCDKNAVAAIQVRNIRCDHREFCKSGYGGHTGVEMQRSKQLRRLMHVLETVEALKEVGGQVCADHGNAEQLIDEEHMFRYST